MRWCRRSGLFPVLVRFTQGRAFKAFCSHTLCLELWNPSLETLLLLDLVLPIFGNMNPFFLIETTGKFSDDGALGMHHCFLPSRFFLCQTLALLPSANFGSSLCRPLTFPPSGLLILPNASVVWGAQVISDCGIVQIHLSKLRFMIAED